MTTSVKYYVSGVDDNKYYMFSDITGEVEALSSTQSHFNQACSILQYSSILGTRKETLTAEHFSARNRKEYRCSGGMMTFLIYVGDVRVAEKKTDVRVKYTESMNLNPST